MRYIMFLIFLTSNLVLGQDSVSVNDTTKTYFLSDVMVTASRTEKNLFEIGRTVDVIKPDGVLRTASNGIGEILSKQGIGFIAGATLNPGMQQSLFLRGSNSNQTAVFIDDNRITDPSTPNNAVNLVEIPLTDADRIEIVKGAHSTMYGSSTIGGVINVISSKNSGLPGLHLNLEVLGGAFGKSASSLSGNLTGSYTSTNGFYTNFGITRMAVYGTDATIDTVTNPNIYKNRDKDNFKSENLVGRVGYKNRIVDFYVSCHTVDQNIDLDRGPFIDDDNYFMKLNRYIWGYGLKFILSKNLNIRYVGSASKVWRHAVNDSSVVDWQGTTDHTYSENTYTGKTYSNEILLNIDFPFVKTIFGIGEEIEKMDEKSYLYMWSSYGIYEMKKDLESLNPNFDIKHAFIHTEINGALFSKAFESLLLSLAVRLNHHSAWDNNITYEINPSYKLGDKLLLYFTYGTGFNSPSLYQLYCPETYYASNISRGNKDLKPEYSHSLELGLKYRLMDKASLSIACFNSIVKNSIQYVYLWDGNIGLDTLGHDWMRDDFRGDTYLNLGIQRNYGIDVNFDLNVLGPVKIHGFAQVTKANLTFEPNSENIQYAKGNHIQLYDNGEFLNRKVESKNIVRRPNLYGVTIAFEPAHYLIANLSIRYIGSRYDSYYNSSIKPMGALDAIKLCDYTLIDFEVRVKVNEVVLLNAKVENVLDEHYSEILGYTTKGRGVYVGTRISL